ncbi:unnamed protein product [Closterium sp. NIES-65]|nr:unnamed protein product [Closterium sp. NIES-65]
MARYPTSTRTLSFAVLFSASLCISYVLSQIRNTTNTAPTPVDFSARIVEFAAGYDNATDISGGSLLLPINDGWTNALAGYKTLNPAATTSSDPVLEALSTVVSSSGSVSALNGMSANAKNALSRLAKFMSISQCIQPTDMQTGNYKNGRFSFSTALNQPIYLYANVTGSLTAAGLVHVFTGTDRGTVDPTTSAKNGLVAGSDAGGPKAVADVAAAFGMSSSSLSGSTQVLGDTTSSSDMTAIVVTDPVFPATMSSLTSSDPVQPYGKVLRPVIDALLVLLKAFFPSLPPLKSPPSHSQIPLFSLSSLPFFSPSFSALLPLISPSSPPHVPPFSLSFPSLLPLISSPSPPHFPPFSLSFPPFLPQMSPPSPSPFPPLSLSLPPSPSPPHFPPFSLSNPHFFPLIPPLLPLISPLAPSHPPPLLPLTSPLSPSHFCPCSILFPPLLPLSPPPPLLPPIYPRSRPHFPPFSLSHFPHCSPSFCPLLLLTSTFAPSHFHPCRLSLPPLLPLIFPLLTIISPPAPSHFPPFSPTCPPLSTSQFTCPDAVHVHDMQVALKQQQEEQARRDEEERRREREEEEVRRLQRQMVQRAILMPFFGPPFQTPQVLSTKRPTLSRSHLLHTNARHATAAGSMCGISLLS